MPIAELDNFRKKYPQYGDMSDADLASSLAKKYPDAYSDLPSKLTPENPAQSTLQSQFGTNPPAFNLLSSMFKVGGPMGASMQQPGSSMRFAGQVGGGLLGSLLGPSASMGGAIGGSLAGEGIRQAIGDILGSQNPDQKANEYIKTAQNSTISELIGAGTGFLLNQFLDKAPSIAAGLMRKNVLGATPKILEDNPTLGQDVLSAGFQGQSLHQTVSQADALTHDMETALQSSISDSKAQMNVPGLFRRLEILRDSKLDSSEKNSVQNVIDDMKDKFGIKSSPNTKYFLPSETTVPVQEANEIKRSIYSTIGAPGYKAKEPSAKIEAYKDAGNYIKTQIENLVPDAPIRDFNQGLSLAGRVKDLAETMIAKQEAKSPLSIKELGLGILGSFLSPAHVLGAVGTIGAEKLLTSPTTQSVVASGLYGLGNPIIKGAQEIGSEVSPLLRGFLGQGTQTINS